MFCRKTDWKMRYSKRGDHDRSLFIWLSKLLYLRNVQILLFLCTFWNVMMADHQKHLLIFLFERNALSFLTGAEAPRAVLKPAYSLCGNPFVPFSFMLNHWTVGGMKEQIKQTHTFSGRKPCLDKQFKFQRKKNALCKCSKMKKIHRHRYEARCVSRFVVCLQDNNTGQLLTVRTGD